MLEQSRLHTHVPFTGLVREVRRCIEDAERLASGKAVMLSTYSLIPKLTVTPKRAGPNSSVNLQDLVRSLASESNRLTYRRYRESKNAEPFPAPVDPPKEPQRKASCQLLPLLPLAAPEESTNTYDDHSLEIETASTPARLEAIKATALKASESTARRRSRSPKIVKVYTRKPNALSHNQIARIGSESTQIPTSELRRRPDDNDAWVTEKAEALIPEERELSTKSTVSRKRHARNGPTPNGDAPATGGKSLMRKRKRQSHLPVSELALVKTIASPTVSEDEPEVRYVLDSLSNGAPKLTTSLY